MRLEYFEATHYQEIESFDALAGVEIIKMMYQNNDMDYLYEIKNRTRSFMLVILIQSYLQLY